MEDYKLYNKAYKYLFYCIHFGFYPSGTRLPSAPELCKAFRISRSTLHSALKMLEDEQYISLSQGRSAVVTYNTQIDSCRKQYLSYRQSTNEALLDLNRILCLIWPETILQGLKLCGEKDLEELADIAGQMTQRAEYPYLEFYYRILLQLGNPLLSNLYLSTVIFGHCSAIHLGDEAYREGYMFQLRKSSSQILTFCRTGLYADVRDLLISNYRKRMDAMQLFHDSLPASDGLTEQIPYRWNYNTERPSVGFDLAMRLLREIYTVYRPMEYLPSVSALSKERSIPVITVRRAIQILSDIGVVKTVNGKGTCVMAGSGMTVNVSCLSSPNMKKVLLAYLQSVQAILLICQEVANAVLPASPDSAVEAAIAQLRQILASGDYSLTAGAAVKLLRDSSQSPSLREILDGLMCLQYLGYPFKDMEPDDIRSNPQPTEALLKSLEKRDTQKFAESLQHLMADLFRTGKEKMTAGGITEAESLAMPSL